MKKRTLRQSRRVAAALLADPDCRHYSYPLGKAARVRPGNLYPILDRMLQVGWLADGWDGTEGSIRRRYYVLTDLGKAAARVEVAA